MHRNRPPLSLSLLLLALGALVSCTSVKHGQSLRDDMELYLFASDFPPCFDKDYCDLKTWYTSSIEQPKCAGQKGCAPERAFYADAAANYARTCEEGYLVACQSLATLYQQGLGVERSPAQARMFRLRACWGGLEVACYSLHEYHGGSFLTATPQSCQMVQEITVSTEPSPSLQSMNLLCHTFGYTEPRAHTQAALKYWRATCLRDKNPQHCNDLARMHYMSVGVPYNEPRALEIAQHGCIRGSRSACLLQADLLLHGLQIEQDPDAALGLVQRACAQDGSGYACDLHASALRKLGRHSEAVAPLQTPCADRAPQACDSLAWYTQAHNPDTSRTYIQELYKRGCEAGDEYACADLGTLLDAGYTGTRNLPSALSAYKDACSLQPQLCPLLHDLEDRLKTSSPPPTFQDRCLQDHNPTSCKTLIRFTKSALALSDKAHTLAERICTFDNPATCDPLLDTLSMRKTPKDRAKLLQHATRLCRTKHPHACATLAHAYSRGLHTPKDFPLAQRLWSYACAQNHPTACLYLTTPNTAQPLDPTTLPALSTPPNTPESL